MAADKRVSNSNVSHANFERLKKLQQGEIVLVAVKDRAFNGAWVFFRSL